MSPLSTFGAEGYGKAVLNILDDFSEEKKLLQHSQRAFMNILEDFGGEKERLEQTQRAVLNILEDFGREKETLEQTQRAVLNILEDLAVEKERLEAIQREVRASLREKEVLLKEIHHRVKNNLQVISSLLSLQARHLVDPVSRELFEESQNRVQSIALVHEKLYRSASLSHIDFSEYVLALVDNLFHAYDARERGIARTVDVASTRLTIDVAIPCGLIVNELVTNSLKHGFPKGRGGGVRVVLAEEAGRVEMTVADDGVGLPAGFDPRRTPSLGLDLVFTFAEQLDAEVAVAGSGGTSFQFRFARAEG